MDLAVELAVLASFLFSVSIFVCASVGLVDGFILRSSVLSFSTVRCWFGSFGSVFLVSCSGAL
jgi:hypothetical protein